MSSFKKLNLNDINRLQAIYSSVEANVEAIFKMLHEGFATNNFFLGGNFSVEADQIFCTRKPLAFPICLGISNGAKHEVTS
jgi:hypothetical protein